MISAPLPSHAANVSVTRLAKTGSLWAAGVNSSFKVTIGICSLAKTAACAVARQMRLIEARIWFRTASV